MCGRFTLTKLEQFIQALPWVSPPDQTPPERYNIAPSQAIAVVPNTPDHKVDYFHWGLIPSWAKDPSVGNRMINARAEGMAEKPAFRRALERRRCIIPADGFYEWRKEPDGGKTPMFVRLKNGRPMAMAGLWEVWHDPDGSKILSCTIITTRSNELVKDIHDRMPVILSPEECEKWVKPGEAQASELLELLNSYPAGDMEAYRVSKAVNNPATDSRECVEPARGEESPSPKDEPRSAGKPAGKPIKRGADQPGLF